MAALVSPIVDIILRLWTCCAKHTRYLRKLQKNKDLLSTAMDELKEARDDVQRRVAKAEADPNEPNMRTDPVHGWLQRVQIIEGEMEVILQKADGQLRRARCLGGCCPPNNCWSNYKFGKSIAKKIPLVKELKVNGHFEEVTYKLPPPSVQDVNLESPVGMKPMFDKVWRLVTSTDDKPVINIGLYGQGGVGKTKLLEKINNEIKTEHGFDIVMFVVVSKPINYKAIQNKIGERLGLSLQGHEDENFRADKIFNALRNKNYVLLLDDIWERVDQTRIGIPIRPQGNSKLIFTTRSEMVCGFMDATHTFQVECLPWDKAWKLFQKYVGEKALNSFSGAREQAELVAKECGGLPLALITIGRAMFTKKSVQEWEDAITTLKDSASEFPGMREKVLARLKLSYDNLSDETEKSCFRYCALFPEDCSIEIAQLVDYWIAEGFLDRFDKLDKARNRGHTIIGYLKSACLLESNLEKTHVKMHDVIRDLALWIVNGYKSSDESGSNSGNKFLVVPINDPCKKWENAERIFWNTTGNEDKIVQLMIRRNRRFSNEEKKAPTSPNLLTLIVKYRSISDNQSFFKHMPLLRVLDFTNAVPNVDCFDDVLISICKLHELQYLKLSGTRIKKLPIELGELVKLKFLVLGNTYMLKTIPAGVIAKLSELQVLDLDDFGDWELEGGLSFSELDGLEQLQEVPIMISTFVAFEKFLCNRKLQMICTGLTFTNSNKSSSSSRRVLALGNFMSLKYLKLNKGFSEVEELVLYGSNLETLLLEGFSKLNNIQWMVAQSGLSPSHFQSLQYIFIDGCHELKDLTWLVYVENLKKLSVWSCTGLETIIDHLGDDHGLEGTAGGGDQMLNTGGGGGGGVFGRLEYLHIHDLPKLKSICRHALAFPSIQIIEIRRCPELKNLPLGSGSNVNNTLKRIEGSTKWWKELQWEDETIMSKFLPYLEKESESQEPRNPRTR